MDIRVTVTAVLDDKSWGFSDLLGVRPFDGNARIEIEKLIADDPYVVIEKGSWRIDKA